MSGCWLQRNSLCEFVTDFFGFLGVVFDQFEIIDRKTEVTLQKIIIKKNSLQFKLFLGGNIVGISR